MINIDIARDFSEKPFGRFQFATDQHPSDGKWTGDRFRNEQLLPVFRESKDKIEVLLDNVDRGFGSSFFDEAFGGLIRAGIPFQEIKDRLFIITNDESYYDEIWEYITEAHQKME
ncbi:STAS-like domain-containing protein [Cognaticolwellia mytili]|uniref:STAS-like domain-containing protein n=1 Tax=Cognaticolwellia mytili TaxID=1888913 RepID=UPI001301BF7D|nr:STAS-like domain-containing protein [Cognaticolwellia mytili]